MLDIYAMLITLLDYASARATVTLCRVAMLMLRAAAGRYASYAACCLIRALMLLPCQLLLPRRCYMLLQLMLLLLLPARALLRDAATPCQRADAACRRFRHAAAAMPRCYAVLLQRLMPHAVDFAATPLMLPISAATARAIRACRLR